MRERKYPTNTSVTEDADLPDSFNPTQFATSNATKAGSLMDANSTSQNSIRIDGEQIGYDLKREAGFACAAWTRERDKVMGF